ncbi:3'-5' exonuclease [Rivularia sp. UHCC 0363]|uniref:3'-5' exonuclease n=1 Tax=Rivularia sp. UHCC 0363 TaxID=3110244 RepID=UPI002B2103E2|nr:3'-5' exonuclease [Rivularia sp. UHCC 0363]MEA5597566.1 3'-5' exonuclease [Rivularia sp. UHCC 0363]
MDYVVIDTEGKPELSELAIIDSQGRVIYEGFSRDHANNGSHLPNLKSLKSLLSDFLEIVQGKKIVCHYAKHDIEVLKFSFDKAGLKVPPLEFDCTCIKAKNHWLGLESYSLEYLSKYLNLRVNNRYFIRDMAHSARYDAEFTYYLYRQLMLDQLKEQPNPFSSSRVDTPFQNHPDDFDTYHQQFITLESILKNIELDDNHQSKGAVVIGEPGSGKTHLMMRLTKARLSSNRLLFIRQPNNSSSVLYHIYSRILESLVERVGTFTQLDYLIINSFDKIVADLSNLTKKDEEILKALKDDNVDALGGEGTYTKAVYWQQIQKRINEWWDKNYSAGGFAFSILRGIIKYCSYTDYNYKNIATRWLAGQALSTEEAEKVGLPNWQENLSLEQFSLEAISVLGKLSILDQPLIIIFDQLEGLGLPQNKEILHQFGETIKEIFTHVPNSLIILNMFPDRWEQFQHTFDNSIIGRVSQYQIQLQRPQENELLSILKVKLQTINIPLEKIFLAEDLEDILEQKSVRAVLNRAAEYYNYRVCQIPLPSIKENVRKLDGNEKIEQQLRILASEQQLFKQALLGIVREIQTPGSVDMEDLVKKLVPEVEDNEKRIEKYVIEYLTKQKAYLEAQYHKLPIISDSDDIGKLKTIAEAFNNIKPIKLTLYKLGKRVLPEHIVIETERQNYVLGFLQVSPNQSFTSRIGNFNELVCLHPKDSFSLFRDERLTEIKGAVAKEKISQLKNSHNGKFIFFSKSDRIHLELTYKLIIDIQNRDLDVDLESALKVFINKPEWYHWLFNMFGFGEPTA